MPRQARLDAPGTLHVLDHYSKVLRNYATDILKGEVDVSIISG